MTTRLTISTRPAWAAALVLLALLLAGGPAAASAQESRTFNAPADRDRSVEKRILDDIGRSL
jgi:hypothetical protein